MSRDAGEHYTSEQRDRCILLATLPGEMQIVHIAPLLYNIILYMYGYVAETTA